MKVLVVDDNDSMTQLMKKALEREGHVAVKTAGNGQDGYLAFLAFSPDVVVTDIEMPIQNGLEMMKQIRTHQADIKAIYMSGNLHRYLNLLEEEKYRYKANFLNKPFSVSQIIRLCQTCHNNEGGESNGKLLNCLQ